MSVPPPATLDALVRTVADTAPGPLQVSGGGTKRPHGDAAATGSPSAPAAQAPLDEGVAVSLDMRALSGITGYDPAEGVVTALAGTPVAQVAAALAAHGQYLPWDPPFGREGSTIGGMVASGVSGPGRYRYGGIRDFVIGARVVDGRGRLVTSGGQVVKNAAGFLTHHALVGSAGRLGVIAEVSFKVFPHPEATCTLVTRTASRGEVLAAHERVRLAVPDLDALDLDDSAGTLSVRLAGAEEALAAQVERAARVLAGATDRLSGDAEARHWQAWLRPTGPPSALTIKIPATPSRLSRVLDRLAPFGPCRASAGGAVVYLQTVAPLDDVDGAVRAGGLRGAVVAGPASGRELGVQPALAFHTRVRRTLDPDLRFR